MQVPESIPQPEMTDTSLEAEAPLLAALAEDATNANVTENLNAAARRLAKPARRWLSMVESRCCSHDCPNKHCIPKFIDTEGKFIDGCLDHTVGKAVPEKANPTFKASLLTRKTPVKVVEPTPFMKKYLTYPNDPTCPHCQEMLSQHRLHNNRVHGSCPIHGPSLTLLQAIYPKRFDASQDLPLITEVTPVAQRIQQIESCLKYEDAYVGATPAFTKDAQNQSDDDSWLDFQMQIGVIPRPRSASTSTSSVKNAVARLDSAYRTPVEDQESIIKEPEQQRTRQRKRSRRVISDSEDEDQLSEDMRGVVVEQPARSYSRGKGAKRARF